MNFNTANILTSNHLIKFSSDHWYIVSEGPLDRWSDLLAEAETQLLEIEAPTAKLDVQCFLPAYMSLEELPWPQDILDQLPDFDTWAVALSVKITLD